MGAAIAKITQSQDDLEAQLSDQLSFLKMSALLFDQGHRAEAKRLSAALRVLFHQTSSSHALLSQLGVLHEWKWLDTAGEVDENNLMPTNNMVNVFVDMANNKYEYTPVLGAYETEHIWPPHILDQMRLKGIPASRPICMGYPEATRWDGKLVQKGPTSQTTP